MLILPRETHLIDTEAVRSQLMVGLAAPPGQWSLKVF